MLFFSLLCATASVFSTFSLGQRCRSFSHELFGQSTVVFWWRGRDAFLIFFCIFVATMFSGILGFLCRNSTVGQFRQTLLRSMCLLSPLLHDLSGLQSSPCFQHKFVWLPFFSRTLVCKGGFFHVHGSTRFVSSSLCYVAVSRARENNLDKPLLDVIIIAYICHYH